MGRPSRSEVSQFLSSRPQPAQVSQPEAVASKGPRCSHPGHRCLRPTNLQCTCCVGRAEGRPPPGGCWEPSPVQEHPRPRRPLGTAILVGTKPGLLQDGGP